MALEPLETPVNLQLDSHAGIEFLERMCDHLVRSLDASAAWVVQPRAFGNQADVVAARARGDPDPLYAARVLDDTIARVGPTPDEYPLDRLFSGSVTERFRDTVCIAVAVPGNRKGETFALIGILLDDTSSPRPQAESALASSASRITLELSGASRTNLIRSRNRDLTRAFRQAPVAVAVLDSSSGRLMDISEGFATLVGRPRDALVGSVLRELDILAEDGAEALRRSLEQAERVERLETAFTTGDGVERWALLATRPIEIGGRAHVLIALSDISDYLATLAALREKETRYGALFHGSSDMIVLYELDPDGDDHRLLEVNDVVCEKLGYAREELLGLSPTELQPDDRRPEAGDTRDSLLAGKALLFRTDLLSRDGERIPVESHAQLFELEGRPVVLSVVRDISEREQAEVASRMLVDAMDASIDGIAIFDEDLRYQYVNRAHQEMNRYSDTAEVLGRPWTHLVPESEHPRLESELLPALESSGHWTGEVEAVQADGTIFSQEASLTRLQDGRTIAVVRDISERIRHERLLRQAEEKYRQIFENAQDGLYQTTPDGRIISANPALARILGFDSPEDLTQGGASVMRRLHVDPQARADTLRRLEELGEIHEEEYAMRRKDGTQIWVSDSARAVRGDDGRIHYYEGALQDITGRRDAEEALAQSEEKYRTLVDTSQDGVFIAQDKIYRYVNQSYAHMLGYTPEEMQGIPVEKVVAPEDLEAWQEQAQAGDQPLALRRHYEIRLLHKDGHTRSTVSISAGTILYEGRVATTGTVRDITEQKKAEEQLLHNAMHDVLTGLPNRSFFLERLKTAMQRAQRRPRRPAYAVLFLDLDRFKIINDSLGHEFGDRFLVSIAERLSACLRPSDLIARHGGDEFTILVEDIEGLSGATVVVERIQQELDEPFEIDGHEVFTNASIGIVLDQMDYREPEELLRDADTAMYRAKADGKSGYAVFDQEMHRRARAYLQLETDLRRALERDEFRVWYQPIVRLSDAAPVGFEALLRWEHPQRGILGPDEFLVAAEETGLIIPIGWWVLDQACGDLASLQSRFRAAEGMGVSVNIAHRQFSHWDLCPRISQLLDRYRMSPSHLRLEITENVFMEDPDQGVRTLTQLKHMGLVLQMDDFGTGYSSLSGIRRLPLDTIKIDRSFIADIEHDPGDLAVIRTIAQLADDLHMEIIAEGVETARQAAMLREIGCSHAQGFYFSHPMSFASLETWMQDLG